MVAQATYQAGKIVAIGDSSIPDDGTGDTGDTLYNGYTGDASGNHQILLMNAIIWLTTPYLSSTTFEDNQTSLVVSPNPVQNKLLKLYYHSSLSESATFLIYDVQGRMVQQESINEAIHTIDCQRLSAGVYFGKVTAEGVLKTVKFIID
jgi:hypothetical protein